MVNIRELLNKKQEELLKYLVIRLKENGYTDDKVYFTNDYIIAKGDIPVLLVAHLDTVHKDLPTIYFDQEKRVLWSPQGIGGDDRCGVYAILKIIENYKPYVLFTTDEEIGGLGAEKFTKEFDLAKEVNFAIEIDRRGFNEAVFYNCGNEDFIDFILSYGLEEEFGSFSDISILSPAYNFASVNLSAGYYNEHTNYEYIVLDHLEYTVEIIKRILQDKRINTFFEYKEVKYTYKYDEEYWNKYYDNMKQKDKKEDKKQDNTSIGDLENEVIIMENDWKNLTEKEWLEKYGYNKPQFVEDIYFSNF